MIEKMYVNYHKHTSLSNRYTTDSPLLPIDYWNELKNRYGDKPCIYSTCEHGWAGNYFFIYSQIEKYNKKNNTNIQWLYCAEAYWVKDRHSDDKTNNHIILIALNDNGRKKINKVISIANKDGYYYKPRLDLELILSLPSNDVMITTACVAFWKYPDIKDIILQLNNHFKYFYLEVQAHNTSSQKELNQQIIQLHNEYNIPIIAGTDSHSISKDQYEVRDDLLASHKIHYEDEEGWYLHYPTYDEFVDMFTEQGVLTHDEIIEAIENTNILFNFEPIILDKSLKVPVIIPLRQKTQEERNKIFEKILVDEWNQQKWDINKNKYDEYIKEVKHDIKEIESCNMADYFILSYYVMKNGQEKYGGVLTPTGRGSAVSMYLNKLLRLTKVDKVNSPVLMYSERFLTKERVLDSHTPPDIDNNVLLREPFIKAQKELVGELGTYDLLAMGTLKTKSAWKMYARAYHIEPDTANEVSKQIGQYELAKKHAEEDEVVNMKDYIDPQYHELIDGAQSYLGIYDTAKGHPCATICYQGDVEEDIGITLCKSEATGKQVLTACIESGTIDEFGYLKQDYLIVDSIGLTYDIYKEIGIEPYSVNQILDIIKDNKKVWDIYANGYTQCVNQCEQEKTTQKVMRYKPKNISELTQFVAGVRPSFQSMYKIFESRQHFDYNIKAFDDLLQDEYCSSSFILYQESLMKVLGFAGFPMSETYAIIKAISKKKDYIIKGAKEKFIPNFAQAILDTGETDSNEKAHELAEEVWTIVENSASYGFNSAHAYCMAIDSVTIAYLKAYYPLEFYKVVLQRYTNKGEKDKVSLIKQEMLKRGYKLKDITFGDDNRCFNIDKDNNCIIQTMASIKGMPKRTPQALYELGLNPPKTRSQLYSALIKDDRINKTAIDILFKLDYFKQYAAPNRLIKEFEIYEEYINKKIFSKDKLNDDLLAIVAKHCDKETAKQYSEPHNLQIISDIIKAAKIPNTSIIDRIKYQLELLGYSEISDNNVNPDIWLISDIETNNYGTTYMTLYNICYGAIKKYKVAKGYYDKHKVEKYDTIKVLLSEKDKWTKKDGQFIKTGEKETYIKNYQKLH